MNEDRLALLVSIGIAVVFVIANGIMIYKAWF